MQYALIAQNQAKRHKYTSICFHKTAWSTLSIYVKQMGKVGRQANINSLKKSIFIYQKGYFHLCPRMDFLQTLHINNSLYTKYENVFIELDS